MLMFDTTYYESFLFCLQKLKIPATTTSLAALFAMKNVSTVLHQLNYLKTKNCIDYNLFDRVVFYNRFKEIFQ